MAMIGCDDGLILTNLKGAVVSTDKQPNSINIAKEYDIDEIKCVIYDESFHAFFILANKREHTIGLFLMSYSVDTKQLQDIICWEHKLPIDDADMSMMKRYYNEQERQDNHKRIVCSFKTQYINTYNIFVINL